MPSPLIIELNRLLPISDLTALISNVGKNSNIANNGFESLIKSEMVFPIVERMIANGLVIKLLINGSTIFVINELIRLVIANVRGRLNRAPAESKANSAGIPKNNPLTALAKLPSPSRVVNNEAAFNTRLIMPFAMLNNNLLTKLEMPTPII